MTRSEIESSLNELNNFVLKGRMMDAFDKYYHDNVIMQGVRDYTQVSIQ